ncbi:DUF7008 domain-containing protein [Streptomyces sp. NPDC096032]|uniref:DUF7008 domain-containing protein n=1 Tax=Streptomyces sp. NPDC096032 TaxID=3366070 RepID=UPI0037FD8C09
MSKERFISYAQTNAATPSCTAGPAGTTASRRKRWRHSTALATEEITPSSPTLELQSWLDQWRNEFDMLYSGSPTDFFAGYCQTQQGAHGPTGEDPRAWPPCRHPWPGQEGAESDGELPTNPNRQSITLSASMTSRWSGGWLPYPSEPPTPSPPAYGSG